MARRKFREGEKPAKIYGWPVVSSTEREGRRAKYTVWLYNDGSLSCDCPGWIFHRRKNGGHCKHTRSVADESADLLARWKRGEDLPQTEGSEEAVVVATPANAAPPAPGASQIKFGRFLEV